MAMQRIALEDCPVCRGAGMLVHDGGWCVEVVCADCGAHTAYLEYETDEQCAEAEQKVAQLWNMGKVVKSEPGE